MLAVLRIQNGRTLYDVLVARPEDQQEQLWVDTVLNDIAKEKAKLANHLLPATPAEAEYRIESIRSWVESVGYASNAYA